jgi:glycerol uptake facilitator protein
MERKSPHAYFAEFVGTFLLVMFIGIILAGTAAKAQGGLGYADFAVIGLLHAFLLCMLVATLGGTSGAHFNPAVTVTLTALRKISIPDAVVYIVMQLAGAVCAALVVKALLTGSADATNYGATAVNKGMLSGDGAGFLAELIGTFALMWAIMGLAVNPRGDASWAPFVIGTTLGFAVMATGPLTGAGLNPARSFGPALVGSAFNGGGTFLLVYVLAPIVGALIAGIVYTVLVINPAASARPVDELAG